MLLLAAVAAAAVIYPRVNDVSTDAVDPPEIAGVTTPDAGGIEVPSQDYPELAPRLYALPIGDVYTAARKLVGQRGWTVAEDVPPLSVVKAAEEAARAAERARREEETLNTTKGVMTQSKKEAVGRPTGPPPEPPPEWAILRAVAYTPVFQFADDVVVRVEETPDGTEVDMRSASRLGVHDLGENARRISRFLADLDLALQTAPAGGIPPIASAPAQPGAPAAAASQ
jgi:hypothetical protein